MKTAAITIATFLVGTGVGFAQVDQTSAVRSDVTVVIRSVHASVSVKGGAAGRMSVSSQQAPEVSRSSDGRHIQITHSARSPLSVGLPPTANVTVRSENASIEISGMEQTIDAQSKRGSIKISAMARSIRAASFNGSVDIEGGGTEMTQAESVGGRIRITQAGNYVDAKTSAGSIDVIGDIRDGKLFTVLGSVRFHGTLKPGGRLSAETSNGSVDLTIPASTPAEYDLRSLKAEVKNEFGPQPRVAKSGGQSLQFRVNPGSARIIAVTMIGAVRLHALKQ